MNHSIIRTDTWHLSPTPEQQQYLRLTVQEYRAFCHALVGVVNAHWTTIANAKSRCSEVERLIHQTSKNPNPKYQYFGKRFYKFPSYLRRSAIEFAIGQVSSFFTRYQRWQSGIRSRKDAKPPKLNGNTGCYPSLYKGQCIKFSECLTVTEIKVWNGSDWIWTKVAISRKRDRHLLNHAEIKSPALIVNKKGCQLSVPFKINPAKKEGSCVCAVDIGINTLATVSIVYPNGTVTARKFIHPSADIDRRDKRLARIRKKARLTKNLHKGFCSTWYRKARQYNRNIAQHSSKQIVDFATEHGASVIVFEQLKGWRPKGGRKGSTLKQRFHGWLHRALVNLTQEKFAEGGGKTEFVYPRGTSSFAFDGSGKVKRSKKNYSLATFSSGKQYNCDLSASYNIGARYWAKKLKLTRRNDGQLDDGKSSSFKRRTPVTLSVLWKDKEAEGLSSEVSSDVYTPRPTTASA
ncbi:transposase, IS605 OrfB family [Halothece sp. PCC 7418]|uniref:IS200/IS605 family element transposase accessory protein TnpB n=1 Tax=Halothece sp. (strain PCC 7418) TaxID=65093 RepID=UPI0002A08239|nr:IS200/IS605 family element transposase accessory protein TnpB [Halothece sp. PCC 7418]AFZ44566.1 transposase, IS605 OrfB family [Halothece sp. PCC 7418]